jgi:hypothetical protein
MPLPFGRVVKQSRAGGVEREFHFFRDHEGKPWMQIKSNEGTDDSFSFNEQEFSEFAQAVSEVYR